MIQIICSDQTRVPVPLDMFAENKPFDLFMDFAIQGISWEFCEDWKKEDDFYNEIREADLRVRSSIFFIREEHANARTLH
jgi:hypothetical protein